MITKICFLSSLIVYVLFKLCITDIQYKFGRMGMTLSQLYVVSCDLSVQTYFIEIILASSKTHTSLAQL